VQPSVLTIPQHRETTEPGELRDLAAVPARPAPRAEIRRPLAAAAILLVVALSLWAPFDARTSPQGDGWILKNRAANGAVLFAREPTRTLLALPWAIAQRLTPESFLGIHLLFIVIIWGKGLALYWILRLAPGGDDGLALLSAALLIVHPASTWTVAIDGPLDRHWAVLLLLVAVLAMMLAMRARAWPWLGAMAAAQVLSLWTNEAILPVALAVPVMIWWLQRDDDRRSAIRYSLLWSVLPACNAAHNLAHHLTVAIAPARALGQSHGVAILALGDGWRPMVESLGLAYRRHLVDCWVRSLDLLPVEWTIGSTAVITAISVVAVALLVSPSAPDTDRRLARALVVAGFALVGLGFAAFVPTNLRFTDGRSFIVSSLGAAIALAGAISWLTSRGPRRRAAGVVALGVAIGLGAVQLLDQRARYDRGSRAQDALLASIVEQAPAVKPRTTFAVAFDETPRDVHRRTGFWPRDNVVTNALQFLYRDPSLRAHLLYRDPAAGRGPARGGTRPAAERAAPTGPRNPVPTLWFRGATDRSAALLHDLPEGLASGDARPYRPGEVITAGADPPRRSAILVHD
jgi:hypothetical protein